MNLLFGQKLFDKEPEVRVRIINTLDELHINFNSKWIMEHENIKCKFTPENGEVVFAIGKDNNILIKTGDINVKIDDNHLILNTKKRKGSLDIQDVPYGLGWWWEGTETRNYSGEISIYINDKNKFDVVVKLMLEDYLKQVIPYEMGGDSPLESLKAQAVAARSEAIIALTSKLYSGEHHDLTSDVECQVFSGNKKRTKTSDKAVKTTRSIILTENGEAINAYYASNCGGHSELIKNVWPSRPQFKSYSTAYKDDDSDRQLDLSKEEDVKIWIESSPDVYCNPNNDVELPEWSQKNFRWTRENTIDELSTMIAGEQELGKLLDIKVLERGVSGRIHKAEFIFEKGRFVKNSELSIRQLWSPSLRSSCFFIEKTDNNFIVKGAGWGHGVGMCQSGAVAMAKTGKNFRSILHHYYRKAKLTSVY